MKCTDTPKMSFASCNDEIKLNASQTEKVINEIGQAKFDEIMKSKLKENTWYKTEKCTIKRTTGTKGFGYNAKGKWEDSFGWTFEVYPESWTEMTPSEIEEVLKRRCEELGTLNAEFECLVGCTYKELSRKIDYRKETDTFFIGTNVAYRQGKFAKKIEKPKAVTIDLEDLKFHIKAINIELESLRDSLKDLEKRFN